MAKRHDGVRIALYFYLLIVVSAVLFLHLFYVRELRTDFFAKFMLSLLVSITLLPVVARIKFFDIIEVTRKTRFLRK